MNRRVRPAITTPRSTLATRPDRVNRVRQGRPISTISTPAQTRRSHAAPSAPSRSINPTETASPSCTHSIDAVAIRAPVRAGEPVGPPTVGAPVSGWVSVMTSVNPAEPFAST